MKSIFNQLLLFLSVTLLIIMPESTNAVSSSPATKRQKVSHNNVAVEETNNTNPTNGFNTNPTNGFNAASEINNQQDFNLCPSKPIPLLPRDTKLLLLDIEGCTTSISFVKDVLFPFALTYLGTYLKKQSDEELNQILNSLKEDVKKLETDHPSKVEIDKKALADGGHGEILSIVAALMNHDVKATGLKALQGKIWKTGYSSKELKGHTYEDFLPMLQWCQNQKISVNIYSSGSINAQKLLFAHTEAGDLCSYFDHHFDTTSGGKKESKSYENIAKDLGISVKEMCFVSDAEAELVAAREAGVGFVVMSVRPGNAPLTDVGKEFPIIYSLLQLCGSGK
mmetsp:Transcript_17168/g.19855  ORF Transcript_17168/g.19855 Transcript_17168/m.19855 type:complete len:338 (+) Transcript_17168:51-1064(+)